MRKIIEGDVNLSELFLTKLLDLSDIEVTGSYNCSTNALNSLKGSPHTVGNRFSCFKSGATSLVGGPHTVGGNFYCHNSSITSLKGSPVTVSHSFRIGGNPLTSLAGGPKSVLDYNCNSTLITNLKGCPEDVRGNFHCHHNPLLKNLIGSPETIGGNFDCTRMDLNSLEGIPKVIGTHLDRYYSRLGDFFLDVTLKERFPEEYIRSLSDIKGQVIYRNIPDPNHHH